MTGCQWRPRSRASTADDVPDGAADHVRDLDQLVALDLVRHWHPFITVAAEFWAWPSASC